MVQTFIQERGWGADRFADWLVDSIDRLLLFQVPPRNPS